MTIDLVNGVSKPARAAAARALERATAPADHGTRPNVLLEPLTKLEFYFLHRHGRPSSAIGPKWGPDARLSLHPSWHGEPQQRMLAALSDEGLVTVHENEFAQLRIQLTPAHQLDLLITYDLVRRWCREQSTAVVRDRAEGLAGVLASDPDRALRTDRAVAIASALTLAEPGASPRQVARYTRGLTVAIDEQMVNGPALLRTMTSLLPWEATLEDFLTAACGIIS